jgi:hypothetical protein
LGLGAVVRLSRAARRHEAVLHCWRVMVRVGRGLLLMLVVASRGAKSRVPALTVAKASNWRPRSRMNCMSLLLCCSAEGTVCAARSGWQAGVRALSAAICATIWPSVVACQLRVLRVRKLPLKLALWAVMVTRSGGPDHVSSSTVNVPLLTRPRGTPVPRDQPSARDSVAP